MSALRRAWWVASATILLSATARAAAVQPDDMFFAPSSLADGVYPIQPMTGDGVTTPWVATWTAADILALDPGRVDISFVGIQVLPVLIPNPSPTSEQGEYSDADLAAITVSNYTSFYMQQPGTDIMVSSTDYAADLTASQVTLTITAPAIYAVRIQTQSRPGIGQPFEDVDYLFSQFAADYLGEINERDDLGGQRSVEIFESDCYVVSLPDGECHGGSASGMACTTSATCPDNMRCVGGTNNFGVCTVPANCPGGACEESKGVCNVFNGNAAELLTDAGLTPPQLCRALTVAAVEQCIADCKEANGGAKVSVTLIGHGNPGAIAIGGELISNQPGAQKTPGDFAAAIKDCVDEINFFSCNVGQGAAGQQFLDDVYASIPNSSGTTMTVSASKKSTIAGKTRAGYWDQHVKSKRIKIHIPDAALGGGALRLGLAAALAVSGLVAARRRRR